MARNLECWQRQIIIHMMRSRKRLITSQMAKVAKCTERSITNIHKNMRLFGSVRSPISAGRPPNITSPMLDALLHRLTEKPCLYVEEMMIFLWDEFDVLPSPSSIKRVPSTFPGRMNGKESSAESKKNRTLICEISINRNYPSSIHINWFLSTSLDVISR